MNLKWFHKNFSCFWLKNENDIVKYILKNYEECKEKILNQKKDLKIKILILLMKMKFIIRICIFKKKLFFTSCLSNLAFSAMTKGVLDEGRIQKKLLRLFWKKKLEKKNFLLLKDDVENLFKYKQILCKFNNLNKISFNKITLKKKLHEKKKSNNLEFFQTKNIFWDKDEKIRLLYGIVKHKKNICVKRNYKWYFL